jgi:hypothetical protein
MELKDFISATLIEIQSGVQAAIDQTIKDKIGGAINPSWGGTKDINASLIEKVQFDIAVTVADKTSGSAEAGIKVVGIKIGGGGSGTTETSNVSRIQFSIPIVPPVTTISC